MSFYTHHINVKGKVQGVFFRKYTQRKAVELGITGWVRNCDDGSVEITAQGTEKAIEDFLSWCRQGPAAAKVGELIEKQVVASLFTSFDILR